MRSSANTIIIEIYTAMPSKLFATFPVLNNTLRYNKIITALIIGGITISLCCCDTTQKQSGRDLDFTDSDFKQIDKPLSEATEIDFVSDSVLKPCNMTSLGNNILAIEDLSYEKMVWLADIANHKLKGYISKGNGPDELLDLTTMTYSDGILSLAGLNDSKVIEYAVDHDSMKIAPVARTILPYKAPMRSLRMNDSIIFSLAPGFSGDRFYLYNKIDSSYTADSEFPLSKSEIAVEPDNSFFQADIAIGLDGKLIVLANRSWNILEFYDVAADTWLTLYGPSESAAEIRKVNDGAVSLYSQSPRWHSWDQVVVGKKDVYVGYNGSCLADKEDEDTGVTRIYTFSHDGTPGRIYQFESPIVSFTIDEQARRIYVIHDLPEPTLVYYNL